MVAISSCHCPLAVASGTFSQSQGWIYPDGLYISLAIPAGAHVACRAYSCSKQHKITNDNDRSKEWGNRWEK
jgi:hypothetical protein